MATHSPLASTWLTWMRKSFDASATGDELLLKAKECRQEVDKAVRTHAQVPEVAAQGAACLQAALKKLKSDDARLPRLHQDLAELLKKVGDYHQQAAYFWRRPKGEPMERPNPYDEMARKQWRLACEHYFAAATLLERNSTKGRPTNRGPTPKTLLSQTRGL